MQTSTHATASDRRDSLQTRIHRALREIGLRELRVWLCPSGAVVSDGHALWTCMPRALLSGIGDVRRNAPTAIEGHESYSAICARVPCLARTDQDRHERIVRAWRREHGRNGEWS